MTWEGFFWLMAALVLLFQGWLRSVNLVALIACVMLALWTCNIVWLRLRFRLKRLRLRRSVEDPVFARRPFTVTLEMDNPATRGRGQLGLRVFDRGSHHEHGWFVTTIRPEQTQRSVYQLTLPRRGVYPWPELALSTGYPFGLARRELRYPSQQRTLVLPALGKVQRGRLKKLLLQQLQPSHSTKRPVRRHPVAQTEFYGLREFRVGDSPKWIHWRTTARMGELMVREFEEPPLDNLVVILEPWLPAPPEELRSKWKETAHQNREIIQMLLASGPAPDPAKRRAKEESLARKEEPYRRPLETLEKAVSFAATVCWEWSRTGGAWLALGVAEGQNPMVIRESGLTRVLPFLESLAFVEGGPALDPTNLIKEIDQRQVPSGPVLLITTKPSGLGQVLGDHLRRPVTTIDVTQPLIDDFFEEAEPPRKK